MDLQLAGSPRGHDPRDRHPWGSHPFLDADGRGFLEGRAVRQYFVDADGEMVRTTDGRFVHILFDERGQPVRGADGLPVLVAVDPPQGARV